MRTQICIQVIEQPDKQIYSMQNRWICSQQDRHLCKLPKPDKQIHKLVHYQMSLQDTWKMLAKIFGSKYQFLVYLKGKHI